MMRPLKILMLEDKAEDGELVHRLLKKGPRPFTFTLATDKKTYLQALDEVQPDLVLSDSSLPGIDSIEALEIMRKKSLDIPFILVSGNVSEEFATDLIKSGADDYVFKDRLQRLPEAINAALKQRKADKLNRKALQELIKNEEKYRTLVERISDGFIALDKEFCFTYINHQMGKMIQRDPASLIGKNIWKECPTKVGSNTFLTFNQAMQEQRYIRSVDHFPELNLWQENHIYPSPDGLSIFIKDISSTKIVEEQLESAHQRLRFHIENAPLGFIEWDEQIRPTAWSKRAEEIFGWTEGEAVGAKVGWFSKIYEEDQSLVSKIVEKLLSGKVDRNSVQHRNYTKDGRVIWCEWFNSVLRDTNGKIVTIMSLVRDITAIKENEREKEFDRNNLAALINNTADLMWSVDRDLRLVTFNHAFNALIELSTGRSLVKGQPILSSLFPKEQLDRYKGYYGRALSGQIFTVIDKLDYPVEYWSEISFYPIRKEEAVIGTACFSRDITERKKNEEVMKELEQAILDQKIQEQKSIARAIINAQEKERNRLGQELHDNVNQILASTKLFLEMAGKDSQSTKDLVKYPIELIERSIKEIRSLSSRQVTPLKNVDLQELVQSMVDKFIDHSTVKIYFKYDVSGKRIADDAKLNIYRILQEQIGNTIKHAEAHNVNVSIQVRKSNIYIDITDDGKGFDLNKKRKGIGISNMMNRVESFNGTMTIESAPGKGCTIHSCLPLT